ncbi:unannotated protein [freshwater metagenome]|uniref:Unannotated protein n=1 Tax=freshwater metagenome TaxID=449393 RepID=A0A6J7JI39_9ZZZZ
MNELELLLRCDLNSVASGALSQVCRIQSVLIANIPVDQVVRETPGVR